MAPRSILAITDFSPTGDQALLRAAQLCMQHGAKLKLLCVACPGEPPPPDASSRLGHHALQLRQRHGLDVGYDSRIAAAPEDIVASARGADLLVWGSAPSRGSLRAFFIGQPVEALIRQCARPVLVVRRPADGPYRRQIVAVDFSEASPSLVEAGLALSPDAQMELFHSIDTINERNLRHAEASHHAIAAYRQQCLRHAEDRMARLAGAHEEARRRRMLSSSIHHGNPARQLLMHQAQSRAELIVLGKHPASAMSDLLFGSTARRVLRQSAADVLVVPRAGQRAWRSDAPAARSAPQPLAVRRMRAGPPQPPAVPNPAALPARAESVVGAV